VTPRENTSGFRRCRHSGLSNLKKGYGTRRWGRNIAHRGQPPDAPPLMPTVRQEERDLFGAGRRRKQIIPRLA